MENAENLAHMYDATNGNHAEGKSRRILPGIRNIIVFHPCEQSLQGLVRQVNLEDLWQVVDLAWP